MHANFEDILFTVDRNPEAQNRLGIIYLHGAGGASSSSAHQIADRDECKARNDAVSGRARVARWRRFEDVPILVKLVGLLALILAFPTPGLALTPSGFAAGNGVDIAYYETGSGPPLLLINGGPGFPAQHFAPLAIRLARDLHMRVIRFDQRGTGLSKLHDLNSATVTLDLMVQDVEMLRRRLKISRWVVMGHSFGGINAMAYAARYPDKVRSLILSAPGGTDLRFLPTLGANIQARLNDAERRQLQSLSDIKAPSYDQQLATLSITLDAYIVDKSKLTALRAAVIDSRLYVPAVNALVWKDLEATHYDLAPALARMRVPTLIVQGKEDPLGIDTARRTQQAIPGSRLTVIVRASHYMWLDNPVAYFQAVRHAIDGDGRR